MSRLPLVAFAGTTRRSGWNFPSRSKSYRSATATIPTISRVQLNTLRAIRRRLPAPSPQPLAPTLNRIPVSGPSITQKEIDYVTDAVMRCWYGQAGEYHDRFERAFAEYIGVHYAVTLPSCTSAIHLSLLALGVGPGDEVIVPDSRGSLRLRRLNMSGRRRCFRTLIRSLGAWMPAASSGRLDQNEAMIPVDLYGNMPDFDAIEDCDRHSIAVIED